MHNIHIKSSLRENCLVCKSKGALLYHGLKDQLFSAPGQWNLSICENCKLIWLSPYPLPEELAGIYSTYYTHANVKRKLFSGITDRLTHQVYKALGYSNTRKNLFLTIGGHIPFFKEYTEMDLLEVRSSWGKRLLDVGSGNGEYLNRMQNLGWSVEGTEFDPKAADFARKKYGLEIHVGDLIELSLAEGSFDVISLNHVIEHVYDPEQLLLECKRILAPGGRIVLLTPNTQSLGHKLFRKDWRGLEIPRHMAVFSVDNFGMLIDRVGFRRETLTSTARISRYLYSTSVHIKQGRFNIGSGGNRGYLLALKSYFFQAVEELCKFFDKKLGEEIYFVGKK